MRRSGRWSFEVGQVVGIPVRVHFTFLVLVVWFGLASLGQGGDFLTGVALIILVFGCVALHELGHALMARRFGVDTLEIVLYPIGGVARLRGIPSGVAELLIAAAGPAVNLLLAIALFVLTVALGRPVPATPEAWLAPDALLVRLLLANLLLFAFNLVPAFPMDGGRILRALLSLAVGPVRATRLAAALGQGFALLFGLLGIISGNVVLMLIALFIFLGAGQEAVISHRDAWLKGRRARDAMITRFERLAPHDSLQRAAQLLLRTPQDLFPVVDAWGRSSGVLSRGEILGGLEQLGPDGAVLEIPPRETAVVGPDTDLAQALAGSSGGPAGPLLVADESGVVGMVTGESLANLVAILSRLGRKGEGGSA